MGRDTSTGDFYEKIIQDVIARCGLVSERQKFIGEKPGGRKHKIDHVVWFASNPARKALISCKVQTVGGTAEEKIVYEVIKLLHAMDNNPEFVKSYLILGGNGWTPELIIWIKNDLTKYVPEARRVKIISTDELISSRISLD